MGGISEIIDIDKIITESTIMANDVKTGKKINFYEKYEYLYSNTPTLFDMIKQNKEDFMPILKFMTESIKKINSGKETEEDEGVKMGEFLAEKYIYPHVDMSKENKHLKK